MGAKNNSYKKTILLVDDEIIFANALSKKMQGMGYDILIAYSSEEAIDLVSNTDNVHLVLMEIDLSQSLKGINTAKQILLIKNLPIVFHTSHFEKDGFERVKNISRYGVVVKNSGDFVLQSSLEMAFELFDAHQRLKQNGATNFFSSVIENIPNMIFMKHAQDLRFALFNRAGETLLGYDKKICLFYRKKIIIILS